jgi:hypothetical protein
VPLPARNIGAASASDLDAMSDLINNAETVAIFVEMAARRPTTRYVNSPPGSRPLSVTASRGRRGLSRNLGAVSGELGRLREGVAPGSNGEV